LVYKNQISSLAVGFFSILNIILSILFVTKYDLNIKGVAYGTLYSAIITSVIFLIYTFYYLSKHVSLKIDLKELIDINKIKNIFDINFNIFIRTILLTFHFYGSPILELKLVKTILQQIQF
jgi:MATE family multidrug resistance protein